VRGNRFKFFPLGWVLALNPAWDPDATPAKLNLVNLLKWLVPQKNAKHLHSS
jgi:hypothetical protein